MTAEQAQKEIAKELPALARGGAEGQRAENRIVGIVAAQRKISRPEAQAQVNQAKQRFVQTKNETVETAKKAADAAAGAASKTSFIIVFALLVGAAAAAFGATAASRRRLR
jgi:CHASE3 domain sensor protein